MIYYCCEVEDEKESQLIKNQIWLMVERDN